MVEPPAGCAAYGVVFHPGRGAGAVTNGFPGRRPGPRQPSPQPPPQLPPRPNTPRYPARHVSVTGDSDELARLGQ